MQACLLIGRARYPLAALRKTPIWAYHIDRPQRRDGWIIQREKIQDGLLVSRFIDNWIIGEGQFQFEGYNGVEEFVLSDTNSETDEKHYCPDNAL